MFAACLFMEKSALSIDDKEELGVPLRAKNIASIIHENESLRIGFRSLLLISFSLE
jgi:hypothetical protein